jgi:8-oxo-dGTP diphosphatase
MQHSHCSYCGAAYPADALWPRTCAACGEITWRNPLPVAVALLPVLAPDGGTGLVVVRRAIEPGLGELGLPGGYIEVGESWQEATVRELREETGIPADAAQVRLFSVQSTPTTYSIQIFGLLPRRSLAALPPMAPTEEVSEWLIADKPLELVFNTHTKAMADYFASA